MAVRFFFYGTLMRGQANHRVVVEVGGRFVSDAVTTDAWRLVDLGPYPALVSRDVSTNDADAHRVVGEVFEIDEPGIEVLDKFEGCPDLYARVRTTVEVAGEHVEAWAYVLARSVPTHAVVIGNGRYADRGSGRVLYTGAREAMDAFGRISSPPGPRKSTIPPGG